MNTVKTSFKDIQVGDSLLTTYEDDNGVKYKNVVLKVLNSENWKTKAGQHCFRLTMENNHAIYGWADRCDLNKITE